MDVVIFGSSDEDTRVTEGGVVVVSWELTARSEGSHFLGQTVW